MPAATPGAERVDGRRREAGQLHQRVGADRPPDSSCAAHREGDLVQAHERAALADRQVHEVRRDAAARGARPPSSPRTDTGTMARTALVGVTASPRVSSQVRSAPVTVASTTSLTEPPCACRTRR